ncbi:fam-l protein [Plasmodium malariae]|uniref:Fam-l protein n=1 Tax=Plasmodium malariae TaxID=5858 RepID=A0A1D3TDN4_PLAMA|nr:fam-l protein [Plasmodium malariae]SCP03025.1 fam-l protein [Plasmodium malariae]
MEQKFMLFFLIKITIFIYLSGICYLNIHMSMFRKSMHEKHNNRNMFFMRTYRLLTKCKKNKDSNFVRLKEEIPNNEVYERKDITNNENGVKRIIKPPYKDSLNIHNGHKQDRMNKYYIFETKKYSYLEKKIFKDLDFLNFLNNNRTISDKTYKKIIIKKCGLRFSLPLLLLLFLTLSLILGLSGMSIVPISKLLSVVSEIHGSKGWISVFGSWLKSTPPFSELFKVMQGQKVLNKFVTNFFGFMIHVVPFIILGFIFILAVVYYHRKVKKYERIKFRKR